MAAEAITDGVTETTNLDRERLRWIASDAPARRDPPPPGLFENTTVGVIDVCNVLARCLVRLEDEAPDAT